MTRLQRITGSSLAVIAVLAAVLSIVLVGCTRHSYYSHYHPAPVIVQHHVIEHHVIVHHYHH